MTVGPRLRFEEFETDLKTGELWKDGEPVRIQDLPFRLLAALLQRPGELLTRSELGQQLWGGQTFVDFEAGLNTAVAKLRDALGDHVDEPRFIETVPKRGYRFVGRVGCLGDGPLVVENSRDTPSPTSHEFSTTRGPSPRRVLALACLAVVTMAGVLLARYWPSPAPPVRVAVVLFDNETGQAELDRLAQALTDSTVARLTADPRLAVIGNASILRTDRPFRDLLKIRDALRADYIVLGQIQKRNEDFRVMAHLIRGSDQAHVWAQPTPMAVGAEPMVEAQVVADIAKAVSAEITKAQRPS